MDKLTRDQQNYQIANDKFMNDGAQVYIKLDETYIDIQNSLKVFTTQKQRDEAYIKIDKARILAKEEFDEVALTYQKSRDRVKQSGEVFTPTSLVQEMLDKLPPVVFTIPNQTFLDNSCGNGQFLIELLKKNIPIDNIYGVDLMADNVCDTIARIQLYKKFNKDFWKDSIPDSSLDHPGHSDDHDWQFLKDHKSYQRDYSIISVRFSHFNKGDAGVFEYSFDQTLWTKVHNIVCKDALDYDYEFDQKTKASLLQF